MKKLKVLSLFSGVGAFEMALRNIGIKVELVNYCEIDKYASKSYCAIHRVSEDLNLWDITKIDIDNLPINTIDMITHGSPCQDFSVAGLGKGGDKDTGTRSSLMWNTVEIVRHCKPRVVLWENVKGVLQSKNIHNYEKYLNSMETMGYTNFSKVLNAKDYGVPQNRERIFVVSILSPSKDFVFPEPFKLNKVIVDVLEDVVDEKYYIQQDKVKLLVEQILEKQGKDFFIKQLKKINGIQQLGNIVNSTGTFDNPQRGCIYNILGVCPSLNTVGGGGLEPKILEIVCCDKSLNGTKIIDTAVLETISLPILTPDRLEKRQNGRRCKESDDPMFTLTGQDRHGVLVILGSEQAHAAIKTDGICPTLTTAMGTSGGNIPIIFCVCYIRKLTPLECWRLMGFNDNDFAAAQGAGVSNSQLYKQAGNSIVVPVLEGIFRNLFNIEVKRKLNILDILLI